MKLFKNKKGSQLVEKIMMVAFALAAGAAVVVYTSNVIIEAKNKPISGVLEEQQTINANNIVTGQYYQFTGLTESGFSSETKAKITSYSSIIFSDYYCDGHTYDQHNPGFPAYQDSNGYYHLMIMTGLSGVYFNSSYGPSWYLYSDSSPSTSLLRNFKFVYQGYTGDANEIFEFLSQV